MPRTTQRSRLAQLGHCIGVSFPDDIESNPKLPLAPALDAANIHHFLVGAQSAMPVDSVGNPWSGSYVYNSGNLVPDLLYNLMLALGHRI